MGGILSTAYAGMTPSAPLGALMAVSCTSVPRGVGLAAYRGVLRAVDRLPSRGLGLTNMRERMEKLGGRLEIDSSPEKGTTIRVSMNIGNETHGK